VPDRNAKPGPCGLVPAEVILLREQSDDLSVWAEVRVQSTDGSYARRRSASLFGASVTVLRAADGHAAEGLRACSTCDGTPVALDSGCDLGRRSRPNGDRLASDSLIGNDDDSIARKTLDLILQE
jgi:hypothetical protein